MTYMKKDCVGAHCGSKSVIDGHQGLHLLDEYWILALSLTPSVSFDHHTTQPFILSQQDTRQHAKHNHFYTIQTAEQMTCAL
jgi:hypothetical protein